MNTTNTTKTQELQIKSFLRELNEERLLSMRCASICAAFVTGAYLTASIQEVVEILWQRHKDSLEKNTSQESFKKNIEEVTEQAITWGIENNIFSKEANEKISPTEEGWFIGQDWEFRLRNGW